MTRTDWAVLKTDAIHKRMTEGASTARDWVFAVVVFGGIGLLLAVRG